MKHDENHFSTSIMRMVVRDFAVWSGIMLAIGIGSATIERHSDGFILATILATIYRAPRTNPWALFKYSLVDLAGIAWLKRDSLPLWRDYGSWILALNCLVMAVPPLESKQYSLVAQVLSSALTVPRFGSGERYDHQYWYLLNYGMTFTIYSLFERSFRRMAPLGLITTIPMLLSSNDKLTKRSVGLFVGIILGSFKHLDPFVTSFPVSVGSFNSKPKSKPIFTDLADWFHDRTEPGNALYRVLTAINICLAAKTVQVRVQG